MNFYTSLVALVISIFAFANAGSLHQRDAHRAEAIITQGIVNAKSSPDRSGTELFTIHEGTKVLIVETIGEWCCIHVGNNVGWIQLSLLERI
jgi:SH3-like domain-containing protein